MKIFSKKLLIPGIAVSCLLIAGIWVYTKIYSPNTNFEEKSVLLYIEEPTDLHSWLASETAKNIIGDVSTFKLTAALKKFNSIKKGRYRIRKGMSNNAIINMLRSGDQEPLTIRTDDVETLYELAGKLGKNLQQDSLAFIAAFTDNGRIAALGFDHYTLPAMLAPNTYEFFWTMSPDEYLKRMKSIYDEYWTTARIEQAKNMGMSPSEVATLASIVKAETAKTDEAPKIAGLYLNRLRIGMPLQSDPTAVFGRKEHAARVYLNDLSNDSPYNTYQRKGLPPGPINFPEKIFLDAVLAPERHDYLYMCAQPEATGYHNFAKTLDQHNVYRNQYTKWLERKGIR